LLIETSCAYGRRLLRGIGKYSRLHGPWAFYRAAPFYRERHSREKLLSMLKDWGADGLVIREPKQNQAIIEMGLPTIISPKIDNKIPGLPVIYTDCKGVGRLAAEHLLERGFKEFAFCGFDEMIWSRQRADSFERRISEAGFQAYRYQHPKSGRLRSWENEQASIAEWLSTLPKPAGLMACNDECGQNVIEACKIANIHVPEELAIIGVDNDELVCDLSDPPLSSVALNTERAGYEAAELLDQLMHGENMADQIIIDKATYIEKRMSSDILAISDPDVAGAVHFIRQNARKTIRVSDVVDAIATSRRTLQQRFRNTLGRSIHEEIRRVRIEQVKRMLMETNLSISQVATALGYAGVEHFARYFKKETDLTPREYRKRYCAR